MVVFLTVATAIVGGWHYFLWARLVRDTELPPPLRTIATVVLAFFAVLMPLSMALSRTVPRALARPLAWVAYGWMGFAFLLFTALLFGEVVRTLQWVAQDLGVMRAPDEARRLLIARMIGGTAALIGGVGAVAGAASALGTVPVERVRIALRRLPQGLSGTTIVQISDIHIGPTLGKDFLTRIVDQVNALEPDVVAITGDLVDGHVAELREHVRPLADLKAKYGVYFVTGNHEYYSGAEEWMAFLPTLGVRVLRNERVTIGEGDDAFDLAGVEDPTGNHDVAAAMAGRDPKREVVLLAHQPRSIVDAVAHDVGLQLSGHTHAGQIFPWGLVVPLQQPYLQGLHKRENTWVYVNRGTGFWGPPMRVGAAPEITRIELVPA